MKRSALFRLFNEAKQLCGHSEFVVIGSLSVLGIQDEESLPSDMVMSNDIDSYAKADPGRIHGLRDQLGESSPFHSENGYYLDPVSPGLPTLPEGWRERMIPIENNGIKVWFLDPDDAAISKFARSQENDLRWIRAGVEAGVISMPNIQRLLGKTTFIDADEEQRTRTEVDAMAAWFESLRTQRPKI